MELDLSEEKKISNHFVEMIHQFNAQYLQ